MGVICKHSSVISLTETCIYIQPIKNPVRTLSIFTSMAFVKDANGISFKNRLKGLLSSSQLTTSVHWPCRCTLYVLLSFIFVILVVCGLFEWKRICLFYMYCHWRSRYQEGRVGIPLTGLNPPQWCMSQARTWISNVICRGLFVFSER